MSQTPSPPEQPEGRGHAGGPGEHGARHPEGTAPRTTSRWLVPGILGGLLLAIVLTLVVVALTGDGDDAARPAPTEEVDEPFGGRTAPGGALPPDEADGPAGGGDDPADGADEPTDGVEGPADGADDPADGAREVTDRPLEDLLDTIVIGTDFQLADEGWAPDESAVERGAREAVTGVYTDGRREVRATAAAFDTIEDQDAYAQELVEQLPADDLRSEGAVYSDESGRYWAFEDEDEQATVVWRTDTGVVLTVSGDVAAASEVFANLSI
ncbi:hypothetical protein PU560_15505 [Georgenia sp. 10Sc9-8]|uniref:DUF4245 family protein n=1 Tax=Georgenia halotolerans TaxID=3028317 RepID=A0ABT5U0J4_9MICO|nr:hypothetical protein [Georgenia halotolerans]